MRTEVFKAHHWLFGISVLLSILICGCNSRPASELRVEWVYVNNSSENIEVTRFWGFSYKENEKFTVPVEKSYTIKFNSIGTKIIDPKGFGTPFDLTSKCVVKTGNRTVTVKECQGIRSVDSYKIEKVNDNHYRFLYVFTDKAAW